MSIDLSFVNNTLTTFVYEPFSYTISNPSPGTYTLTTSNSSGIPPGYLVNNGSNVVFSASSNGMGVGTENFTVTARDASGTTISTSSNTVNIGAGRFLDASGASYAGRSFTFFKNEPITPLPLGAPFAISTPTSVPTLPPGLTFTSNASNSFSVTGTPTVTVPQSNYLFIGKATGSNLGKIVTSQIGLSISNERVLLNLSGSPIVSPMTVGTAIAPRTLTAQFPPYPSLGTLRYTWSGLPDGITVTDLSGNVKTSPFPPSDTSYTLRIEGAPTLDAANAYRNAGISSNTVTFTGTRTNPLPQISNSQALTFGFGETVLFDSVSDLTLYSGVALDPSANFFRAQTYFVNTGSGISNIFSPDLRSDLSINFVPGTGRGYLTGTPTSTGSASYTIRAINSNVVSRDISVPITVAADVVTFEPPTPSAIDTCFNFILSRPISVDLSGYYPTNIQFRAVAASGKPVIFSTSSFNGTGLSLSNVNASTVQLVGTPEAVTALTTANITASAVGTPATATTSFKYAILNDVLTFSQPTSAQLSFIQNRAITPIQLSATSLSGRQVISYISANLPSALSISTTGLITGTPTIDTSGSFTITGSTGFMSQNQVYAYNLTPDSLIFAVPQQSYTYAPLDVVSIPLNGITYSGTALSNYAFSGFSPTYGLSVGSTTGVISGTLQAGFPPDPFFPTSPVSFNITANAGSLNGTLPSTFSVSNPVVSRSFVLMDDILFGNPLYVNDDDTYVTWTQSLSNAGRKLVLKNTSVDSNVYLLFNSGNQYKGSPNGVNWIDYLLPERTDGTIDALYTALYSSNQSNWYGVGPVLILDAAVSIAGFYRSSDDGITWTRDSQLLNIAPRGSSGAGNYFTSGGLALGSNNGVLLVGGSSNEAMDNYLGVASSPSIKRSTDEGQTWTVPTYISGPAFKEVGEFEVRGSTWVAVGSTEYTYASVFIYNIPAHTLYWSDDLGDTWTSSGRATPFDVTGTQVAYAGGNWLAVGLNLATPGTSPTIITKLAYSDDGKTWGTVSLPVTFTELSTGVGFLPLPEIGSIWFDDTYWYVLVKLENSGLGYPVTIFQHSLTGDLSTGWTTKTSSANTLTDVGGLPHDVKTNLVRLGTPTTATLSFSSLSPNGPTLVSPTTTSYLFYQYVTITPIEFTATGSGQIYYFVNSTQLPRGLSFDPQTATLSGTPVVLGQSFFTIYVKDDVGVTGVGVSINTIIPTVTRQQTSAGSWTSLIRQYTIVNAAQNSVNGRVLPATEATLGEFMRPEPPDSVSAPGDPNCVKKC